MPTWYQEQLRLLSENTNLSVDSAGRDSTVTTPVATGSGDEDEWYNNQIKNFNDNVQIMEPQPAQAPVEKNDMYPIVSQVYTFGKQAFGELWYNMLPSIYLSGQMALHEGLQGSEWLANNTIGKIPGAMDLDAYLQEKVGAPPLMSDLQKKYLLDDAIGHANAQRQNGAAFTSDLINTWDEVHGVNDAADWVFGSLGKMGTQIVSAIYTGGGSAIGQSAGNVYLDGIDRIAKEKGITRQEVVDQDLDEPVIAMMAGGISGLIELAGAKATAGMTSKAVSEGVKKFMNSAAGKVFRNKVVNYTGRIVGSSAFEAGTEVAQSVVERSGAQASSGDSFEKNINRIGVDLTSPDAIREYKESARQAAIGGGAGRGFSIASGGELNLHVPEGPLGSKFSMNVLVPDESKHGQNEPRKPLVKKANPDAATSPKVVNSYTRTVTNEDGSAAIGPDGNTVKETVNEVDVGLVDERTGQPMTLEQVTLAGGLAEQFSFNGEKLQSETAGEAVNEVLAQSALEAKVVHPITGKIFLQKAATNMDGTTVYASGLNDADTGRPVLITENPNAEGAQFSAYEGGVTGNTAEEVAQKVFDIGTPKVTDAQGNRANDIFNLEGVNKDTLFRVYKDVFGYTKEQATSMSASMMNKINLRIEQVKRNTTPTDLANPKNKQKPTVLTPSEAFNQIAAETHNVKVKDFKEMIAKVAPQVSKKEVGGEIGITSIDESVKKVEGLTPEQEQESADRMGDDFNRKMKVTGTAKEKLATMGRFLRDNLGWKVEKIKTNKKNGTIELTVDGKAITLPIFTVKDDNAVVGFSLKDIVNSKQGIVDRTTEETTAEVKPEEQPAAEKKPEESAPKPTVEEEKKAESAKEEPKATKKFTPEIIHAYAQDAKVDYNSEEFKDVSEKLTGKRHLDDMNNDELAQVADFLKFHREKQKQAPKAEVKPEPKKEAKKEEKKPESKKNEVVEDKKATQELSDAVRKAKSIRAGLEILAKSDNKYAPLAQWLLKHGDKKGLDVPVKVDGRQKRGAYRRSKDGIELPVDADIALFLHEGIHGFTAMKLAKFGIYSSSRRDDARLFQMLENPKLDKNVSNLIRAYQQAKKVIKPASPLPGFIAKKLPYGLTNLDEFLAEGLTNPNFQKQLDAIPFPGSNKSIWKTLVDAIKGIIGLSPKEGNMLESFLHDAGAIVALDRNDAGRITEKKDKSKIVPGTSNKVTPAANAIQERKPAPVPVQPTPTNSKEVGKRISKPEKITPPSPKEIAKAKEAEVKAQIEALPKSQRLAVNKAVGEGMTAKGVKKFGGNVHPIAEVVGKAGNSSYVTYKGEVFFDLDKAVKRSLIEEKKPKTKKQVIEQVSGDTSEEQPSMQSADEVKPSEMTMKQPESEKPAAMAPLPPKRMPEHQPSVNPEATSTVVMHSMVGMFGDQSSMNKNDMLDFIANLDENGKALGKVKAVAILDHMITSGFAKARGSQIDLTFPDLDLYGEDINDDEDIEIGGAELGDPNVDYRKASREAVEEAKKAAGTSVDEQAQKDMVDSVREFWHDAPEGLKNDLVELTKSVSETFGVTIGAARGLIQAAQSSAGLVKGVTLRGQVSAMIDAFSTGRGQAISNLAKGLRAQAERISNIEPSDIINPVSWARGITAILSSGVSFYQAGMRLLAGDFEAKYIQPRMMKLGDWIADLAKKGVTSRNILLRNATLSMQGLYRSLAYTKEEIRGRKILRGKRQEGALFAGQWMDSLYTSIGRNEESLKKIHAVLDPQGYAKTKYKGTTYGSLSDGEKKVYSALRVNMDNLHNWSLKMGYIDEKTFLKFVNKKGEINYFGRDYQEFYEKHNLGEDFGEVANTMRADFSIYKHRQEFDDLKKVTLLNDPIYIAAQRMATALQNQAITEYAESIYNNNKIPRFDSRKAWEAAGSPKGFVRLGKRGHGNVYGPLTGMYVPLHIGYDFKGFFINNMMNGAYTVLKKMDRWWLRRKQKEILTVFNPAINIGNQASNYTFAFLNGIDTMNFNIGLQVARESVKTKDGLYQKLLAEGMIGTGIIQETAGRTPLGLNNQSAQINSTAPSVVQKGAKKLDEIRSRYSEIDDKAKIAAYWVKTHVYGMSHEAAITDINQGFQDYDSVGMYYDVYSKIPVFGNVFAKFTGDLARIVTTNGFMRPLTTISYLGMMKLMAEITSGLSDEDEIVKEVRTGRAFQPKIPIPFFEDISLGWLFGKTEVNVARFIAPYQTYDKSGSDEGIWTAAELLPFRFAVMNGGGKPAYLKFDDPMFGTIANIFFDRDFRNISPSDPKKLMISERGSTILDVGTKEFWSYHRMMNRLNFYIRSWGFIPATAADLYKIHTTGEDYYGRKKDFIDRTVSVAIRVEEFSTPEAKQAVMREIQSRSYEINGIAKDANTAFWHFSKEAEKIQQKNITPEQKAYQIQQNWDAFHSALGDMGPRLNKAVKELYEPASYLKALQGNTNTVKAK